MKKIMIFKTENKESATHLTSQQLAERLNISAGTLGNWRVIGKGPKFMRGKPTLYPISEVEKWEKNSLVSSTSQKKR